MSVAPSIEQYAAILRRDYRQRTGKDKRRYDDTSDMPDWHRIAKNVIDLRADPRAFMDAAFMHAGNHVAKSSVHSTGAPYVNTMKNSEWCLKAWKSANPQQYGMADDAPEFSCSPREEWKLMQRVAGEYFLRILGKVDLLDAQTLQELREPFCNLHPVARVVLSDNDPEVLRLYGKAAHGYLWRRQELKRLIESEGFKFETLPPDAIDTNFL